MLAALSGCAQPPAATTLTLGRSEFPTYFAASSAGAFIVAGQQAFTVAEQGAPAKPAACCSESKLSTPDGGSNFPRGGSVALEGTPWVVLEDGSAVALNGTEHPTAAAIRRLRADLTLTDPASGGKPAKTRRVNRFVQNRGVGVVDSTAVLAATFSSGTIATHAIDSVVYRVDASGKPVAVAGRPGPGTERPVSGLSAGEQVAATSVDLEGVLALVALDQSSFVLFMVEPITRDGLRGARLQAAAVTDGRISRLRLPELCAEPATVAASRTSDHEVVLNARQNTGRCRGGKDVWTRIDTARNAFTAIGSGDGFAAIAGDQLLTATAKTDLEISLTMRWQDLPTHR